jgi:hypothetical protein
MQLVDLITHKIRINTHWEDYYRFGFYKRNMTWSDKVLYIGDFSSYYWPWENNSLKFDSLFIQKTLHKPVLAAEGLPTTRILLKAGPMYTINTVEKFADELAKVEQPFVTKIDGGGGGMFNMSFVPEGGKYRSSDGLVDAEHIWRCYHPVFRAGFLVEERVENHPVLAEMHPSSLNTLRLNMVQTIDGTWHQLRPCLKIGRGGSHIDNISSGGLLAALDDAGVITAVHSESGEKFDNHPDTGVRMVGKTVPDYSEALNLAMRASNAFGFMGTIGWDIGITANGPTIIEGNARWWAEIYQDVLGPFLTPEIAAGLVPRYWWTPWNKTHMYPTYADRQLGGIWRRLLIAQRRRKVARRLRALKTGGSDEAH